MHDFFIHSNFTLVFNGYYMILSGLSFNGYYMKFHYAQT